MSGLRKFQDNEAWRQKLRAYLLNDCQPKKPAKMEESKEMRYSLSIDEDIRNRAKKVTPPASTSQTTISINEDTIYEGAMGQFSDRDDSFDAFERMCDKTASDPNSTLFQYLHSEDKSQVVAMAKDRSVSRDLSADDQKEIDALRRMLEAVGTEDLLDNESPVKGVECTQLEDVEAPSRFWDNDNTMAGFDESSMEPKTKVSPVKMVGLMRPSTIIEDNELDSDMSSQVSFQSARTLKTNASSCYETATDTSLSGTLLSVDDLFYAAIAKAKPPGMSKGEELELLSDLHGSLKELTKEQNEPVEEEQESDYVENTIIELSSSDDEEVQLVSELKQENISSLHEKSVTEKQTPDVTPEEVHDLTAEVESEDKENDENQSMHFNDTMEEMQYMMKKGMEYITGAAAPAAASSHATAKPKSPVLAKSNTFVMSPRQIRKTPKSDFLEPSLPLRSSNKTPQSLRSSPCKAKQPVKHDLNMEWTKKKFFGASSGIPQRRQQQIKQPYANIVSPIRTYTQKSGTAPLMALFRQTSADVFSTLAISELEQESRLCQPKPNFGKGAGSAEISGCLLEGIDSTAQLLPKKAYISSEIKHVVDERTPLPMPSVPRIQKYLNSAVEPTVLRHDGKMKMANDAPRNPSTSSHIPRLANHSLADLSLASGDVSLYTIRDAQKF
ncbi:hypothetical protein KR067_008298 [Drosophila pandora]|nr:hypothetical protein KR067_008298 [Drosophila pandora]